MLLIGSQAAILDGLHLARKPADIDIIMAPADFKQLKDFLKDDTEKTLFIDKNHVALKLKSGEIIEIEMAWPETSSEELLKLHFPIKELQVGPHTITTPVASLDALLALKLSHRYKKDSPHFLKTMRDIHVLRDAGAKVDHLQDIIKLREKETYGYLHPNLKRTKKQFFADDAIKYVFCHDSVHEVVAHLDKPMYKYFSVEGEEVLSSRQKFAQLPELHKLYAVVEESYVLALERSQIPFRDRVDPKVSFDIALMKVCSSITSGWFREYAWEHYDQAQKMYDPTYVERFWTAVDYGKVKPFAGSQ